MFTNTALARTSAQHRLLRIFALAAATMLLAVLLHLLIFHLLTASDVPTTTTRSPKVPATPRKDTEYTVKHVESCPEAGFFFKRESTQNSLVPDRCYLCFCQGDHTAVCWKRDNRKCNEESFQYHAIGKRAKRSPGFSDIFFRDASRDYFNKNSKTQCKPYESSFSDDCPPADWCVGCTVCDCDANGRWDCHLLSFCPEGKNKSGKNNKKPPPVPDEWLQYMQKSKDKLLAKKAKARTKPKPKPKPKGKPKPIAKQYKKGSKPNYKGKPVNPFRRGKKPPPPKRIVKKNVPLRAGMTHRPGKMKTPVKYRKIPHSKPNRSKMIKRNIAARKPIQIKKKPNKTSLESKLAHSVMQNVMEKLRREVTAKMKNMSESARRNADKARRSQKARAKMNQTKTKPKTIKKRNIKKPNPNQSKPWKKMKKPIKKPIFRAKGKPTKKPQPPKKVRNRRSVTMSGYTGLSTAATQDNYTEPTNSSMPLNVIPVTNYPLEPYDGNFISAVGGRATLPENAYYRYTIGNEEPMSPISNIDEPVPETVTTQFNKTETVLNLISPQLTPIAPTAKRQVQNTGTTKMINSTDINPEENEVKYSKWYNFKVLKEKKFIADSDIEHTDIVHKGLLKFMPPTDKSILLENKIRNHGRKVERKLIHKKCNMMKLLNHSKCKFDKCNIDNISIPTRPPTIRNNLHGYLNTIKKIFNYHPNNNTLYPLKTRRKLSVLRYLKGIFNKIFKGKKTPVRMNRRQLIETMCENFGPCLKMSREDKVLLNIKLAELNRETAKILKLVKIIKGLLKLLDLPKINDTDILTHEHVQNDIQKLSHVLKGSYENGTFALTSTQRTQIEYIKRCTEDFIKLVGKFASLLNEIIAILTKQGNNQLRNKGNNYSMYKNLDESKDDPFRSLKNVLLRYNLVQNKFMKQMYEQLSNFENKINVKSKVSEVKDFNNSVAIENISRNIIQNLRKLKRLAQTVSYRGRRAGRTKRNVGREDDAIEYLLMMMEFLMKQNHPLDAEPVNDGIDLLIDAIKNAPDIKPIKKKVLEYTPAVNSDTTTISTVTPTPTIRTAIPEEIISDDDSPSESDKTSSSEDSTDKIKPELNARKLSENKDLLDVNIVDDEKELEDKFQFDRKADIDKAEEIPEMSFFSKLDKEDKIIDESETLYQSGSLTTMKPYTPETETIDKSETSDGGNIDRTPAVENNSMEKTVDDTEPPGKKVEVFVADMDEENVLSNTVTTVSDLPTIFTTAAESHTRRLETKKSKLKMENTEAHTLDDGGDKKSKLKWIEENFGKESEKGFVDVEVHNFTLEIAPVTSVTTETLTSKTFDKIEVTAESRQKGEIRARNGEIEKYDVTEKKKTATKLSAEEIMFRKQMELLNSLDYGTERSEPFEAENKDSNVEERYSGDSFPSYFV